MLSIPTLYVHGFNIGFGVGLELSEASQHITHECYVVVAHSDELLFFCEDVLSPFFFFTHFVLSYTSDSLFYASQNIPPMF